MLISVYGDSLGMPRTSEGIGHFDTYSEVARNHLQKSLDKQVAVFNRSQPGRGIDALFAQYLSDESYLSSTDHDVIVIQCGVVDCAPRPVPERVRKIIGVAPIGIQRSIIKFLHANRSKILSSGVVWRLTEAKVFSKIMAEWLKHAAERFRLVIVIEIAPVTAEIDRHSPGFFDSVVEFNRLIASAVPKSKTNVVCLRIVEAFEARARRRLTYIATSDGHHLTIKGQRLYGRLIALAVRRFFRSQ